VAAGATAHSVIRDGKHVFGRPGEQILQAEDILVVEITTESLEEAREAGTLALEHVNGRTSEGNTADVVLMPQSIFVGSRVGTLEPLALRGIRVIGVVPQRLRIEGRLADLQLGIGDILVLEDPEDAIGEVLDEADLLRLSPRDVISPQESSYTVLIVFAIGVLVAAFGLAPPEIALGLVVLVLSATGSLRLGKSCKVSTGPS
jgi:hypothetical protein